jgi:hypothetical protein
MLTTRVCNLALVAHNQQNLLFTIHIGSNNTDYFRDRTTWSGTLRPL